MLHGDDIVLIAIAICITVTLMWYRYQERKEVEAVYRHQVSVIQESGSEVVSGSSVSESENTELEERRVGFLQDK